MSRSVRRGWSLLASVSASGVSQGRALATSGLVVGLLGGLLGAGCGGATPRTGDASAVEPTDRCVVALRFVGDESSVAEAVQSEAAAVEVPHTEVSLVRICDRHGRVVAPLGTQTGVCQHTEGPAGTLIAARCWWPGQPGVLLRVLREGARVSTVALDEDPALDGESVGPARPLGSVELPDRSRVEVLLPGRRLSAVDAARRTPP